MASITSLGTGSGLELESLITKLMTVEKAPLTSLQKKQSAYETKISAMGKLQSALSSLQTSAKSMKPGVLESATTKFAAYTASVTDTAVATATATTGAIAAMEAAAKNTLLPALNEDALGPKLNPFAEKYWKQFGGGPTEQDLQRMDPNKAKSFESARKAPR